MQQQDSSKGLRGKVSRVVVLPARYGLGPDRMGRRIERMIAFMSHWEAQPTIPVTASVLDRHPSVISSLRGADLAIHGYRHRSYANMSVDQQAADLDAAISAFGRHGLVTDGFQAPYLSTNPATFRLLKSRRFVYDSSVPEFSLAGVDSISRRAKKLADMRYGRTASVSRSDVAGSFIELPVALPDDEILVDGLGLRGASTLTRVVGAMADQARVSAGHLILQVHPERFHLFSDALRSVMEKVTEEGGWKASLAEVASWILAGKGGPGHWPGGRPYALSVTGDLDAVSLADFASRVLVT